MSKSIPFHKPYLGPEEEEAVISALHSGQLGGDGPFCKEAERYLEEQGQVKHALLTTSCTHAMELAMMVLGLGPGDEVIMPSFTFSSTANAVVRQGARPVFVDIEETTLNVDPLEIEKNITPQTRAIMPVHYAGQGCRMDEIVDLARRHELYVVEDAAQVVGAKYNGRALGTFGHIGCYSFHVTKNITCGEGGAFLTDDDEIARRAEIMREKGTNRSMFLRGEVDKYTWVDVGSSFVLSEVLAALLLEQLKKTEEINRQRGIIWERYRTQLSTLEDQGRITLPHLDPRAESNYHIFFFLTDPSLRDKVIAALKERGIGATFHYVPLHSSPYGQTHGQRELPVTDRIWESLIRLPLYPHLSLEDQDYVIASLYDIYRTF